MTVMQYGAFDGKLLSINMCTPSTLDNPNWVLEVAKYIPFCSFYLRRSLRFLAYLEQSAVGR